MNTLNSLRAAITDIDTTLPLSATSDFSESGVVQIESELIYYAFSSDNSLNRCLRGVGGTIAVSHAKNKSITFVETSAEQSVTGLFGMGVPTDGVTGLNISAIGSLYTDNSNGALYVNTGTLTAPIWTVLKEGTGVTYPLLAPNGSEASPSYSSSVNPSTGLLFPSANTLEIACNGGFSANFSPTQINFFPNNNDTTGMTIAGTTIAISAGPSGGASVVEFNIDGIAETFDILFSPSNTHAATFDRSVIAGDTRMLLWDVTAGTLKRVTIGAADSGGVGFKVLRIPN